MKRRPALLLVLHPTRSAEVKNVCARIEADIGPVSILVNNVGSYGTEPGDDVETITDEEWDFVVSLTLSSTMRFTRGLVGGMKRQGYGRIVNISSSLKDGVFGDVGTVHGRLSYVSCKMAVVGLTQQLANDLGPFSITVNCVSLGLTLPGEDARITRRFRSLPRRGTAQALRPHTIGRLVSGEDIANAMCFLAKEESGYISGQVITVADGGYR
jgi:NAD(P)-dependent dehydrogenase (short-subunit alcohol dehydrogenase family)